MSDEPMADLLRQAAEALDNASACWDGLMEEPSFHSESFAADAGKVGRITARIQGTTGCVEIRIWRPGPYRPDGSEPDYQVLGDWSP